MLLALAGCAATPPSTRIVVVARTGLPLSFIAPRDWSGPSRQSPPAYDAWSFGRDSCHIALRVDRASPDSVSKQHRWLNANDAEVTASLREQWEHPRSETITYISIDGQTVRFRAAHDVAGEQVWGNALFGGSELTLQLDTETPEQVSQYTPVFLEFVRSIHIETNRAATPNA